MKEIDDEIKLTLHTLKFDIDDGARVEFQNHLYSLLEIKRNELQKRLVEPDKSLIAVEIKKGRRSSEDIS